MSRLEAVDGQMLAIALTWRTLPGMAAQRKEVAQFAKDKGLRFGVVVRGAEGATLGLGNAVVRGKCAGAAMLAATGAAVVYLHPMGTGEWWVCAVKDGAPQPEGDVIVPESQMLQVAGDFLSFGDFRLCSPDAHLAESMAANGFPVPELLGFSDLAGQSCKGAKVQRVVGMPPAYLLGAAGMAIGLAGAGWWMTRPAPMPVEMPAAPAAMPAPAATDGQADAAMGMQMLRQQGEQQVGQMLGSPAPGQMLAMAVDQCVRFLPEAVGGWAWKTATINPDGVCLIEWVQDAAKPGSAATLAATLGAEGLHISPGKAVQAIALPPLPARTAPSVLALDTPQQFLLGQGSALENLRSGGIQVTIEEPGKEVEASGPGATLVAAGVQLGAWAIEGKGLWQAYGVANALDGLSSAAVRHITIKREGGNTQWMVEGLYAVRQ